MLQEPLLGKATLHITQLTHALQGLHCREVPTWMTGYFCGDQYGILPLVELLESLPLDKLTSIPALRESPSKVCAPAGSSMEVPLSEATGSNAR